jgi:Lrp/AsnC family transcriptional regulator for asnA, asnC and gidA
MTDPGRRRPKRVIGAVAGEPDEAAAAGGPGAPRGGEMLDELDKRVIRLLQDDGRMPNTEIARVLRVSETTVRKRISQLVSRGLINIVAVPTPRAV